MLSYPEDIGVETYPDPETIARISFYSAHRTSHDDIKFKFYPAARCKDIYSKEIESLDFYKQEFENPRWICPDISDQVSIYNSPHNFDTGLNFVMVVSDCSDVEENFRGRGFASYTDAECASKEYARNQIDGMRVSYKIMGQNFNPSEYQQNGSTSSVMKRRFTQDLMTSVY